MSVDRDARIVAWTHDGRGDDTEDWNNVVYWGYWREAGNSETPTLPDALFQTEEEALAFATVIGKNFDTHVGPCVLRIEARDNYEVPP